MKTNDEAIEILADDCDFLRKHDGEDLRGSARIQHEPESEKPWRIALVFYLEEPVHTGPHEAFYLAMRDARKILARRARDELAEPKRGEKSFLRMLERSGRLREIIAKSG